MKASIYIEKSNVQTSKTFEFTVLPEKGDKIVLGSDLFHDLREFLEDIQVKGTTVIVTDRLWEPSTQGPAGLTLILKYDE